MPLSPDDTVSPKQAARLLKTHVSTIYRLIGSGKLRSFKHPGTRHLLSRRAVLALLVEEKHGPREQEGSTP
jgi:excisionase family DNA binding protein